MVVAASRRSSPSWPRYGSCDIARLHCCRLASRRSHGFDGLVIPVATYSPLKARPPTPLDQLVGAAELSIVARELKVLRTDPEPVQFYPPAGNLLFLKAVVGPHPYVEFTYTIGKAGRFTESDVLRLDADIHRCDIGRADLMSRHERVLDRKLAAIRERSAR